MCACANRRKRVCGVSEFARASVWVTSIILNVEWYMWELPYYCYYWSPYFIKLAYENFHFKYYTDKGISLINWLYISEFFENFQGFSKFYEKVDKSWKLRWKFSIFCRDFEWLPKVSKICGIKNVWQNVDLYYLKILFWKNDDREAAAL